MIVKYLKPAFKNIDYQQIQFAIVIMKHYQKFSKSTKPHVDLAVF